MHKDVSEMRLPVIVGLGGINSAGRSSGFHSYKRLIHNVLSQEEMQATWQDLANKMGIEITSAENIEMIKSGTLMRRIESFDPDNLVCHHTAKLTPTGTSSSFIIKKSKIPNTIPKSWVINNINGDEVGVSIRESLSILLPGTESLGSSSGANLPTGFDPGKFYNSHHHPRGLAMTVYGISDALNSLGVKWERILSHIQPDQVAVYAGSALSQIDKYSLAGLVSQPLMGNRVSSKMLVMSLPEMPADFINSYVLNNVGTTGANIGACASFLYNLKLGINDIQSGAARVVIVGGAEAPIEPEIMRGLAMMGALATDAELRNLDNSQIVDFRRACRPFSTNAGLTVGEAAQFLILMDDELALELGANIFGSVAGVYVNADANKKSISKPGIGNYVSVAKIMGLAKSILGERGLQKTFVHAHGTGTPQNRTSESRILNEVAKAFSIDRWIITAIKSHIGHSFSAAGGDQIIATLGTWQYGWIPGITTIDHIASDVSNSNLNILMNHTYIDNSKREMDAAIINAKGFGGNNATGLILSPNKTLDMLQKKYGNQIVNHYKQKNEKVADIARSVDLDACMGNEQIIYSFGETIIDESLISITPSKLKLPTFEQEIDLDINSPYTEYN